ncbi:MAG: hypothetical protein ABIS50_08445 [Luteolibacter sp.]|uniref:hypothetical protein n=1 Tax=Luteolibacter sp. TaxID=1962973 RepID=UPI0032663FA5
MILLKKLINLFVGLLLIQGSSMAALPEVPDDANAAKVWKLRRDESISELLGKPENEKIPGLGEMLRQLESLHYRECLERDQVVLSLRTALLAIPGHAKYFAEEIAREQKEVEPYLTNTGPRVSYDFNRTMYFKTLSYLPSPETIAVLGQFLSDDKDTPVPLESPGSDWGENPRANSYGSTVTIMDIGLRNPPVAVTRRDENPDTLLAETRAWWDEIKSGRLPFSFIGQLLEYRFKPDGTWESTPLPPSVLEQDPKPVVSPASRVAQPAAMNTAPILTTTKPRWPWILGGVTAMLVGIIWLRLRLSASK